MKDYQTWDEVREDYNNFRNDWIYDAEHECGEHKSGLKAKVEMFETVKVRYDNLGEWSKLMQKEGMTHEEIDSFRYNLGKQLIIISNNNPSPVKENSKEELEEWFEKHEAYILECARENGCTEEEIKQMEQEHRKFFDKRLMDR